MRPYGRSESCKLAIGKSSTKWTIMGALLTLPWSILQLQLQCLLRCPAPSPEGCVLIDSAAPASSHLVSAESSYSPLLPTLHAARADAFLTADSIAAHPHTACLPSYSPHQALKRAVAVSQILHEHGALSNRETPRAHGREGRHRDFHEGRHN